VVSLKVEDVAPHGYAKGRHMVCFVPGLPHRVFALCGEPLAHQWV
jgi:hypothetical protein